MREELEPAPVTLHLYLLRRSSLCFSPLISLSFGTESYYYYHYSFIIIHLSLLFGTGAGALSGEDLSHEGQERQLIQKANEYFAWAAEDPKLVGMAPWHYGNRPSSLAHAASEAATSGRRALPSWVNPSMDHGAAQYPGFLQHLMRLGWVNVSQMMPAELCGLV